VPVEIQALAAEHVPHVVAACQDWRELAAFGAPYWRPRSGAELERKIASMAGPGLTSEYTFIIADDDRLLGECSVHAIDYRNRAAQVGICIWEPAQRRLGHGPAALRQLMDWSIGYLGLRRLEAWIVAGNEPSVRMVERLGFSHEGTLGGRYLVGGEWRDMLIYGYIAPDAG
jgi:RimJ/RimL family protein N-acetyltransferase